MPAIENLKEFVNKNLEQSSNNFYYLNIRNDNRVEGGSRYKISKDESPSLSISEYRLTGSSSIFNPKSGPSKTTYDLEVKPNTVYVPTVRLSGLPEDIEYFLKNFKKDGKSEISSDDIKEMLNNAFTKNNFESSKHQNLYGVSYGNKGFSMKLIKSKNSFAENYEEEKKNIARFNKEKNLKKEQKMEDIITLDDLDSVIQMISGEKLTDVVKKVSTISSPKKEVQKGRATFDKAIKSLAPGKYLKINKVTSTGAGARSTADPKTEAGNFYRLASKGLLENVGFTYKDGETEGIINFLMLYFEINKKEAKEKLSGILGSRQITSAPKIVKATKTVKSDKKKLPLTPNSNMSSDDENETPPVSNRKVIMESDSDSESEYDGE